MNGKRRCLDLAAIILAVAPQAAAQDAPRGKVTTVKLRITDHKGGPVQSAHVELVREHDHAVRLGRVPEAQPRDLTPKDFDGDYALLEDLPVGTFRLLVEDDLHAKTLSDRFELPANQPPKITVRLDLGGMLTGRIVGPDGKPVSGAKVSTEAPDAMSGGDNPFAAMMDAVFVPRQSLKTVTTDADGRYALPHLAAAEYRLRIEHEDFVPGETTGKVADKQTKALADTVLAAGAVVRGIVTRQGKAMAGIEITFTLRESVVKNDRVTTMPKLVKATTDGEGRYRLPQRVPPGKAFSITAGEGGDPIARAAFADRTKRAVTVAEGEAEHIENFELPKP